VQKLPFDLRELFQPFWAQEKEHSLFNLMELFPLFLAQRLPLSDLMEPFQVF
jgi:hypothetical protein